MEELGFDINQVTWGYRDIFRRIINELHSAGLLGEKNERVTRAFFDILQHGEKSFFDTVLNSYLKALKGEYRWIMRSPRLFERWSRMGLDLAKNKYYMGDRFFSYSAQGLLGETPREMEFLLDLMGWLREECMDLVPALMKGYTYLNENLDRRGIREFVGNALTLHRRNKESASKFLAGELTTSEVYVRQISRQVNLRDEGPALERLARALTGEEFSIEDLGGLDSDDLQEHGTTFVCCDGLMYLPAKSTELKTREMNRRVYWAMVTIGCASHNCKGFSVIHGGAGYETCHDLFKDSQDEHRLSVLFYLAEVVRIMQYCRQHYPGVNRVLEMLTKLEIKNSPPPRLAAKLLEFLLGDSEDVPAGSKTLLNFLKKVVRRSHDFRMTRDLLLREVRELNPSILKRVGGHLPFRLSFFPDPFFPLTISRPAGDQQQADLHDEKQSPPEEKNESNEKRKVFDAEKPEDEQNGTNSHDSNNKKESAGEDASVEAGYLYDEWNEAVGDYQRNWCRVKEIPPGEASGSTSLDAPVCARRIEEVFERIQPDEVRTINRLREGDSIHIDHLMEYLSQGRKRSNSEPRFYQKPLIDRRDMAVSILLDISGSTAGDVNESADPDKNSRDSKFTDSRNGDQSVLQLEKEAAFVLASGLNRLGDSFSIYGFTGVGRENCLFYRFKDFDDTWDRAARQNFLSTRPGSSTRIGPALRHAGWRMAQQPEKTRLLLLITDGKPCDQGYGTESQYAQHDVRKACQENQREGIHTFCVSTSKNDPADMELMFPRGRYVILTDFRKLPVELSQLYLHLTH